MHDLPDWVWQLVAGLIRYEDEHPQLRRMASDGTYQFANCPQGLLSLIPPEVQDAAELLIRKKAIEAPSMFAEAASDA